MKTSSERRTHPDEIARSETLATWKQFLLIFLPTVLLVLLASFVAYQMETKNTVLVIENEQENYINQAMARIETDFRMAVFNLLFLSEQHAIHTALRGDESAKNDLAAVFASLCRGIGNYDQVRLLDRDGMEVVRVDCKDGAPSVVPDDRLQFKGTRYYFTDTLEVNGGEVYVSRFDLNVENGIVQQPIRPTIRFGTPMIDADGNKDGAIVINYLGERMLADFQGIAALTDAHMMLLDSDGYWLSGGEPGQEWGFMFDGQDGMTFGNLNPNAWHQIETADHGQFTDANGVFTFKTVYPLTEGQGESAGVASARGEDYRGSGRGEYSWKVVSHVAPEAFATRLQKTWRILFAGNAIMIVASLVGSTVLARARVSRSRTNAALQVTQRSVDNAADAIFWMDHTGHLVYVNNAAADLLGCSKERLQSISMSDIDPETFHEVEAFGGTAGEPSQVRTRESRFRREDRNLVSVDVTINRLGESENGISCVYARDITERKKAEERLRQLSRAVEESPSTVTITDLEGTVEYVNPKFEEVTGYSSDEVVGQNIRILKSSHHSSEFYKDLWESILAGNEWHGQFLSRKKNGELFWEQASISPIRDNSGQITHFVAVKEDITDRKKAEEELQQNIKDLQRFSSLVIGREEKMIGLKQEINDLLAGMGEEQKYKIV